MTSATVPDTVEQIDADLRYFGRLLADARRRGWKADVLLHRQSLNALLDRRLALTEPTH